MPKTYPYQVRLTDEEKKKLRELADADYRTMADWMRSRIHIEYDKLRLQENQKEAPVAA